VAKKNRWTILHEDDDLIIIDKPAPFLTIPDRYDPTIPSLKGSLSLKREQVFINHRLDKETSGLILFTKNEAAHKAMSLAFENREIDKFYKALVHNEPAEEVGLIDLPIGQAVGRGKGMKIDPRGKSSQTKYRILKAWGDYALVEINLLTGRQHQIRVHMKAINCPVVADSLYGYDRGFYLSDIKRKFKRSGDKQEQPLLNRVGLHAHRLRLVHPSTGETLEFNSDLPKDMRAVIYQLDKNS